MFGLPDAVFLKALVRDKYDCRHSTEHNVSSFGNLAKKPPESHGIQGFEWREWVISVSLRNSNRTSRVKR